MLQPLGAPTQVLALALSDSMQLCVIGSVYAEYEEVLRRPRLERSEDVIKGALDTIRQKGFWVRPFELVNTCSDSDDNMFLECAQAARADYLVTGNLKHSPASWAGTRVVTARWLLEGLSKKEQGETPGA